MMLDETVQFTHALFKDDCCLTITDTQREMTAHFSHKGSDNSCITTTNDVKSFYGLGFSTTRRRTSKKSYGSGTQLPYSVQGG